MSDSAKQGVARWEALARSAAAGLGSEPSVGISQQRLLAFRLDATAYALPVEVVREIVRIRPITPVPRVPEDVRGVISLRGEIVQVVDLRRRLGLEAAEPTRSSRIVVIHGGDERVTGLLVDAVTEVFSVGEDAVRPATGDAHAVESLVERDGAFVSTIDLNRILSFDAGH